MKEFQIEAMTETLNQRIARYRKAAGLSQGKMAELLGINRSAYSYRERCGNLDYVTIIEIADILGVDPSILVFGENKRKPTLPECYITNQEKALIKMFREIKPK